jgi:hypothetical protein
LKIVSNLHNCNTIEEYNLIREDAERRTTAKTERDTKYPEVT